MGGRRRKQSGKGRRQLRSSDSEESDVIDMNSKSKKSDETNREEPNKGADGESRIFSCVIVIFLTPQDVNVVSVQRKWLKSQITRVSSKAKRVNNSPPQFPLKYQSRLIINLLCCLRDILRVISPFRQSRSLEVYHWNVTQCAQNIFFGGEGVVRYPRVRLQRRQTNNWFIVLYLISFFLFSIFSREHRQRWKLSTWFR